MRRHLSMSLILFPSPLVPGSRVFLYLFLMDNQGRDRHGRISKAAPAFMPLPMVVQ
jgi:hypothetical protein